MWYFKTFKASIGAANEYAACTRGKLGQIVAKQYLNTGAIYIYVWASLH